MNYKVFLTGNNTVPCEGPRTVPVNVTAAAGDERTIDLSQLITAGKISNVQGLFVNNVNGGAFEIECLVTGHRVKVMNGQQATIPLLATNSPVFVVRFSGAGVTLFQFVNFPTQFNIY